MQTPLCLELAPTEALTGLAFGLLVEAVDITTTAYLCALSGVECLGDIRHDAVAAADAHCFAAAAVAEYGLPLQCQRRLAGSYHCATFNGVDLDSHLCFIIRISQCASL